jgi:3-keto-5-aminohexanoate cleavage enzyme
MSKVIVTVAPTGGFAGKEQNPDLPTQPDEIAEDVAKCREAGASIAAIHARNPDGSATCNPDIYTEINNKVRDRCDIVINNSTGGGFGGDMDKELPGGRLEADWEERKKGVEAEGVEMATFDCFTTSVSVGEKTQILDTSMERCRELAERFQEQSVKPEWEALVIA